MINREWWYTHTSGPLLRWKLWRVVGAYSMPVGMFLGIMFLMSPAFVVNSLACMVIGVLILGIVKEPWKALWPIVIAVVVSWVLNLFLPWVGYLVTVLAWGITLLVGVGFGLRWLASYVLWRIQLHQRENNRKKITVYHKR